MPRTLAGKLAALLALSVALAAILSWVFATRGMRAEIDELLTDGLSRDVGAIKEVLDSCGAPDKNGVITSEELAHWSELLEVRITIIGADGAVLADSSLTNQGSRPADNHRDRPEVKAALSVGSGTDRRYSETTGIPYLYYAGAFQRGGEDQVVIRCSLPLSRYYDLLYKVRMNILLAHVLSGLLAVIGGIIGVRRVARPISELTEASRARPSARPRYPSGGALEIEELSRAMKEGAEARERMMAELKDDHDQLLTVVQSAPCGLMLVGADGKINCANGALAPLLRDAPERLEGADADGALRAPELIGLIAKGRAGEFHEASFEFRYGTAERCYHARALPAGQRETLLILDDITERSRMEEARKTFVADAGHELRTPLTSISVAAELLGGMADSTAEARAPYIEEIMRQRDRMTALVDDLLLLSKLESGVPGSAARGFDLAEMARSEINEAKKNPKSGHIAWEADIPDTLACYGRPEELRRSIANLMDNSVKYTYRRYADGPGGRVSISVREEGGACILKVTDNGTGIPKEEAGRLFGRFERLERDRARDGGGTGGYGLGLAIVKTAVESHGGKVTLNSGDGLTEFTITLPLPR
ncbi:MAG: ATP-binding protein [Synergistaceae bacterium]|jgi:two-component system phosphate regulon sensor histidine kinase PhoR|nr:ATP-binding protein [Synergistaceae bacterium]